MRRIARGVTRSRSPGERALRRREADGGAENRGMSCFTADLDLPARFTHGLLDKMTFQVGLHARVFMAPEKRFYIHSNERR